MPLVQEFVGDARACFPFPFDIHSHAQDADAQTVRQRIDALDLSAYDRDLLGGVISSLVHSEDSQGMGQFLFWVAVQLGSWDAFLEVAGEWPIVGGTRRLLDAIAGESVADLRLGTPVAALDDDGAGVSLVAAAGERIRVRQVVVATPLNTLADIAFTSGLPDEIAGLVARKQPMRTRKIWVRVKGEISTFSASAPAGKAAIATARTEYRHEGDTLVVCFCSDTTLDPEDKAAVQAALRVFVPDIEVVDTACHDWVDDPYSQGTWAHHRPGDLTGAVPRMRAGHGRLSFAGGDIAPIGVGGIEGAIESGATAARRVTALLQEEATAVTLAGNVRLKTDARVPGEC